eukprot:XP_764189.1 hypothetical protein [Theileria parva strain Muguga]
MRTRSCCFLRKVARPQYTVLAIKLTNLRKSSPSLKVFLNSLFKHSQTFFSLNDQNLPEADNLKTFLSQFSNDQKMNILTTRIVELENAVSDLSEKNRKLKIEREETDIHYKNMRLGTKEGRVAWDKRRLHWPLH